MTHLDGCQIPGYQRVAEGEAEMGPQPLVRRFKRSLARPWSYLVKPQLKRLIRRVSKFQTALRPAPQTALTIGTTSSSLEPLQAGDWVKVRSREEIEATLGPFKELKGCAFLEDMWQYCGTIQRVLQPVERFLDERDYKVKKARGVILLEGVLCRGTPVFGRCDRACHLFWREEWLEKTGNPHG